MNNSFFEHVKSELSEYGRSLGRVGQLRLIGLVSRVLGLFLLIFTLILFALALFTFIAVAAIDLLGAYMPVWAASLVVSCAYLLLIVLAIVCRKPLFIHPFIRLLSKQCRSEEELAIKTLEAEHEVNVQLVRMQCEVDNATRELAFYTSLFSRVRELIRKVFHKR